MIEPFLDHQVSEGKISYGLSSMGYDVRISDEYRIFTNVNSSLVDPKNFSDDNFIERKGPHCIIPPNSFVLAKTVEYFRIPKDVLCICVGKSTYARTGIICNVTPIENEFEGNIVIELSNTTPNPAKIYSNEGIAQFFKTVFPFAKHAAILEFSVAPTLIFAKFTVVPLSFPFDFAKIYPSFSSYFIPSFFNAARW